MRLLLTHDKDQLYMCLEKSRGAELLVAQHREMQLWCEQPGSCLYENERFAALHKASASGLNMLLLY